MRLSSLFASAVLALCVFRAASSCESDLDCSLNGVCGSSKTCECDPAWKGDACELLSLLPADASVKGGAYGYAPNVTSWGGNPVLVDGEYHLFVAEMKGNQGLDVWQHNSMVTHATSKTPQGPFTKRSVTLLPEAHNPIVIRLKDGRLALFHIGSGNASTNAKQGKGGHSVTHLAPGPDGPWTAVESNISCNNPAPMQHPNGTIFLVCKNAGSHMFRSDSGDVAGPWTKVMDLPKSPPGMGTYEDPFLYLDKRGNWHIIFHSWNHTNDDNIAGHYYSTDGLNWITSTVQPYGNTAMLTDGTQLHFTTRERPKILFNDQGEPAFLYNGVNTNQYCTDKVSPASHCKVQKGYDWCYTFVQPIQTSKGV